MNIEYRNLSVELAPACADLELRSFPSSNPDDLYSEADFRACAEIFPAGFFVALHDGDVVGQAGGILLDFDFDNPQHSVSEILGEHGCGNHDPNGEWYYGTDIAVHPDWRRRGIGAELYRRRKQLVRDLGKRGIIAGGYLAAFHEHKAEMTAAEYCRRVVAGELYDPTLTFQLENGFEVRGVLENYLDDSKNDGWASLIVWPNEGAS